MNKYGRLRKKISSQNYYKERLVLFMKQEEIWEYFKKFKCDTFFVGRESARVNKAEYDKRIRRVRAEVKWYAKKLQLRMED